MAGLAATGSEISGILGSVASGSAAVLAIVGAIKKALG